MMIELCPSLFNVRNTILMSSRTFYITEHTEFDIQDIAFKLLALLVGFAVSGIVAVCVFSVFTTGFTMNGMKDEELHTLAAQRVSRTIYKTTGSVWLASNITRAGGYVKETADIMVGKKWSNSDLQANEAGIVQGTR